MAGDIVVSQQSGAANRGRRSQRRVGALARGLGWFSIALGLTELVAPRAITRALGLRGQEGLMRAYGLREIGTGIGILAAEDPAPWIWGRVGGDALDLATVAGGLETSKRGSALFVLLALGGVTAVDVACGRQLRRDREMADPDGRGAGAPAEAAEAERSITIGKTARELYERWRDPATLGRVMAPFATVRSSEGGTMHWQVAGPLGQNLDWETEAVGDRSDEAIGWQSLPDAQVPSEGSIRFRPATGGRGTVATLRVRFDPPGGVLGDAVAKLLGGLVPATVVDTALHRFKSLVETGEIPTTERQPAARADPR